MYERRTVLAALLAVGSLLGILFCLSYLKVISIETAIKYLFILWIPLMVVGQIVFVISQRRKTFKPFIEEQLHQMGYFFLSERPLTLEESINSLRFEMPYQSYLQVARNERMIEVRNEHNVTMILHCLIIKSWKGKIKLEIVRKLRLDP